MSTSSTIFRWFGAHLSEQKTGLKVTVLFGLQLFYNMTISFLSDTQTGMILRLLCGLREKLANTYAEAMNSLCRIALSDPSTAKDCYTLLCSLGINTEGTPYTKPAIGPDWNLYDNWSNATISKSLDIWSLGHQGKFDLSSHNWKTANVKYSGPSAYI